MSEQTYHLFEVFGVELEYMIVDANTLSVVPLADQVMHAVAGEFASEVELGELAWSNELMAHVIELKTNGPAADLTMLPKLFQEHVGRINEILQSHGASLTPTAMNPWMDPHSEAKLWPHEHNAVYESFDRIFDCRGHGWANLQSAHLNLPFANDEEFGRLHTAIRLLLPIMPALSASSPVMDGSVTGVLDNRMEVYRNNARAVPSVAGDVVPEAVFTKAAYQTEIFERIYRDIAPYDPDGILQHEWLNSRGAIARFQRNTIEIRVLDVQECPLADVAICAAISAVLRLLTSEKWTSFQQQQQVENGMLVKVLQNVIHDADEAQISDADCLRHFGLDARVLSARELWQHLIAEAQLPSLCAEPIDKIITSGCLARRIVKALGEDVEGNLKPVYRSLSDCLLEGRMFE